MLRIAVFCGGTGSIALQNGLDKVFGHDRYHLDVIINAYDNGKSTGMCRRAFNNSILGPSDLRKNQLTEFALKWKKEIAEKGSYYERLYSLFNLRLDAEDYEDYWKKGSEVLRNSSFLPDVMRNFLLNLLKRFLFENHERLSRESFKDVALSNIFYAQAAHDNGGSLGKAGDFISTILEIDSNIHLISDVSLMLKARTVSGRIIEDEGKIVDWCNSEDRIKEIFLVDPATGEERVPIVDEGNALNRVQDVVAKADIVIFSSGTQWSSLIPTYVHSGFMEMIQKSKARKYLVMNNVPDKDMAGMNANDILLLLKDLLPLEEMIVVFNDNAQFPMQMSEFLPFHRSISGVLSEKDSRTHDPVRLVERIFRDYFNMKKDDFLLADLDGTMIESRGNAEARLLGQENIELFNGIVLTGNTKNHVREHVKFHPGLTIYCDYGMRLVEEEESTPIVSEEFKIDETLMESLEDHPDFKGKIRSRDGYALTIKPLINRREHLETLQRILMLWNGRFKALIAGRTSIDVLSASCSKMSMLLKIMEIHGLNPSKVLYVGNELDDADGNDYCVRKLGIRTFNVRGIEEFNNLVHLWHAGKNLA